MKNKQLWIFLVWLLMKLELNKKKKKKRKKKNLGVEITFKLFNTHIAHIDPINLTHNNWWLSTIDDLWGRGLSCRRIYQCTYVNAGSSHWEKFGYVSILLLLVCWYLSLSYPIKIKNTIRTILVLFNSILPT